MFLNLSMDIFGSICLDLNDYRAQYVHSAYEKWKTCNLVLEGITYDTWAILESMCYGVLCSFDVDDTWDLFESLASYQWQCESASERFVFASLALHGFSISICRLT